MNKWTQGTRSTKIPLLKNVKTFSYANFGKINYVIENPNIFVVPVYFRKKTDVIEQYRSLVTKKFVKLVTMSEKIAILENFTKLLLPMLSQIKQAVKNLSVQKIVSQHLLLLLCDIINSIYLIHGLQLLSHVGKSSKKLAESSKKRSESSKKISESSKNS